MKFEPTKYVGVVTVTVVAIIVMITIAGGSGRWEIFFGEAGAKVVDRHGSSKLPVSVKTIEPERVAIIDEYYGRFHPLERYVLAFEAPGRLAHLGTNEDGGQLDVGDVVVAGQMLAQLDTAQLQSTLTQAKSRLEQAQSDWNRAEEQRKRNIITAEEYESRRVALVVAKTDVDIAAKRLEDATLVAPTDGVIIRRMASVGESVNAHLPIFEIDEIDQMRLIVDVPESRIQSIRKDQPAYVTLHARDAQNRPYSQLAGCVYRVGRAADAQTGVFQVEVVVDNPDHWLKAGLVGKAEIVVNELEAFRLPDFAAVTRSDERTLFAIGPEGKAVSLPLDRAFEQRGELILTELPEQFRTVVVRGQHRLVDGSEVHVMPMPDLAAAAEEEEEERVEISVSSSGGAVGK